ncbi:coil containing protein [Vibrio phage 2.275.O._10N.286.54.E11]|nr:coil containing protein [Vibrio phage 2.275.O._10N.286.54.E11]
MAKKPVKILKVQNAGCFDDLDIQELDEQVEQKKARKLDMYKEVLPACDGKNYEYYQNLAESDKKGYQPLLIMRNMSYVSSRKENFRSPHSDDEAAVLHAHHLLNVNDFVNKDFWTLAKHTDLQHRLLSICGIGVHCSHGWLPMMKKAGTTSKIDKFLKGFYPRLNELELSIMKKSMTNEEFETFLKENGFQDKEFKLLVKDWKAEKKKGF